MEACLRKITITCHFYGNVPFFSKKGVCFIKKACQLKVYIYKYINLDQP